MSKPTSSFARITQDWVQIFAAGEQTDSKGNTKVWTQEDLDEIARNFNANDGFPMVVGHPKADSPAFGWGHALKSEAGALFAKFRDIAPQFIKWGQDGHIRNRSVKIVKGPKGFQIAHVGFLGAMPPAVEGMPAIEFAADEGESYEFAISDGFQMSLLARALRRLRDLVIEKFDVETADRALPAWDIEHAEQLAADASAEARRERTSQFNAPEPEMSFTKQQLDEAVEAERQKTLAAEQRANELADKQKKSEFAANLAANTSFISALVSDKDGNVRLTPAGTAGWAEALTFAQSMEGEAASFTFSAADGGEQSQPLYEFLKAKLSELAPRLKLGQEQATRDARPKAGSSEELQAAAAEFQKSEADAGREITISQAVDHVLRKNASTS